MLKAVLVGVGGMGGVHLNEYKNIKNVKLVAACDVRLDMLKEKTNGMDINLYSDFDDSGGHCRSMHSFRRLFACFPCNGKAASCFGCPLYR